MQSAAPGSRRRLRTPSVDTPAHVTDFIVPATAKTPKPEASLPRRRQPVRQPAKTVYAIALQSPYRAPHASKPCRNRGQHRFCWVDDGAGSGVKRHHVWPCHDAVLRHLRHFRHSSNVMLSIVGARRWIATTMRCAAYCIYRWPMSRWDRKACMCCECWWALPKRAFCQNSCSYLTYWFPVFFRARANVFI